MGKRKNRKKQQIQCTTKVISQEKVASFFNQLNQDHEITNQVYRIFWPHHAPHPSRSPIPNFLAHTQLRQNHLPQLIIYPQPSTYWTPSSAPRTLR